MRAVWETPASSLGHHASTLGTVSVSFLSPHFISITLGQPACYPMPVPKFSFLHSGICHNNARSMTSPQFCLTSGFFVAFLTALSLSNMIMALQQERLELDRERSNPAFESWRLSSGSEGSQQTQTIIGKVCVATESSYDSLHTRTSLLKNHLRSNFEGGTVWGSLLYTFLNFKDGWSSLARIQAFMINAGIGGKLF